LALFFKNQVIFQGLPEQHVSLSLALLTAFVFGTRWCALQDCDARRSGAKNLALKSCGMMRYLKQRMPQ
jgi:hypothetical protein